MKISKFTTKGIVIGTTSLMLTLGVAYAATGEKMIQIFSDTPDLV